MEELRTGPELIVGFIPTYKADAIMEAQNLSDNASISTLPPVLAKGKKASNKHDENLLRGLTVLGTAVIASTLLDTDAILEKWNKLKLEKVGQRYINAINTPEVLWTMVASQLLAKQFPDLAMANTQLAIMDSESRFKTDALHPSKAYGLMQIIPSNVKHIARFPQSEKIEVGKTIAPVIAWVATIDPTIAANMKVGAWPESLTTAAPLWQIPYVAVLWREANRDLNRSFKWDGSKWLAKTTGAHPVVNSTWLGYMKANPALFSDFENGRAAIMANLWKHGAPRGLYKDVPLTYLNAKVDHITPVVEAFTNLEMHPTLPSIVKSLMNDTNKQKDYAQDLLKIMSDKVGPEVLNYFNPFKTD